MLLGLTTPDLYGRLIGMPSSIVHSQADVGRPRRYSQLATWELRAEFAQRIAHMYSREVPAYEALVDESASVNHDVLARDRARAERFGHIDRVTAERHGAVRVGTPQELADVARVFAAFGMYPVGFYDLRQATRSSVPVISTAFRPLHSDELARNPFRMFTSLLVTDDRRFFDAGLQSRIEVFLARRRLFPPEMLALADEARANGGLDQARAEQLLAASTRCFQLSNEPVDRAWYAELEAVSPVAADIAGLGSTHINHLTPRVLDIDDLYRRMAARGITMIDTIQGPPAWDGVDVLLRQTSFRALDERRPFRETSGAVTSDVLRVRFGEVESRGVALTPAGRDLYDAALAEVDLRSRADPALPRAEVARTVWTERMPRSEAKLFDAGLGYFRYEVANSDAVAPEAGLLELIQAGAVVRTPVVYEDFLPRSAAGIFQSNLTTAARRDDDEVEAAGKDTAWMSEVIGAQVADPYVLYAAQQQASLDQLAAALPRTGIARRPPE
jgi:uncharacterized glyoxalase superfamily metalloenzyme YdcJ